LRESQKIVVTPARPEPTHHSMSLDHSDADPRALVIVVDDDLMVLSAVSALVEAAGFQVISTTSASEAARLVGACRPALVLTDLRMPGMNGIELAWLIHHQEPDLPVVIMTGAGSEEITAQARHAGAATVLAKPIDEPVLLCTLDAEIRARSMATPRQASPSSPRRSSRG